MKILILGLNYSPESTSIGPYTADLAEYLQAHGHQVHVVTGFPSAPGWKVYEEYCGKRFLHETVRGVSALRTYTYIPNHPAKTFQRILFDSSFALSALAGLLTGRPDLIVAILPPLQLAITAWALGAIFRVPVFLHIKDVVPDAAADVGALREGSLAWNMATALERFAYRKASGIGVISEGMRRNLLRKNVPASKIVTIPDYIDPDFVRPRPTDLGFRKGLGIGADEFTVMYSGSVSKKQGLETFVEAGAEFEGDDGITCCLIGDGPNLAGLQKLAQDRSLRKFQFRPLQPRENLGAQFSAADLLVLTQRKTVRDSVFPGKLLYYMAAGRPILAAANRQSETARFLRENDAGLVVEPENSKALADAIRWLKSHPERTEQLGRNGRNVVERNFDRATILKRFTTHLESMVKPESSRTRNTALKLENP